MGTLVAVSLTAFGMIVSVLASSNRLSLSVSLFVLLALFAPTLLPGGAKQGWAGELLQRVNPMTAAEHYMRNIVINQYDWTKELSWLVSPVVAAWASRWSRCSWCRASCRCAEAPRDEQRARALCV